MRYSAGPHPFLHAADSVQIFKDDVDDFISYLVFLLYAYYPSLPTCPCFPSFPSYIKTLQFLHTHPLQFYGSNLAEQLEKRGLLVAEFLLLNLQPEIQKLLGPGVIRINSGRYFWQDYFH